MDMLVFGREIEAHGEKWIVVMPLQGGCYVAVKKYTDLPAKTYVIQEGELAKKGGEK